jgi:hypothetical protein
MPANDGRPYYIALALAKLDLKNNTLIKVIKKGHSKHKMSFPIQNIYYTE